jgi:hypothetical protein
LAFTVTQQDQATSFGTHTITFLTAVTSIKVTRYVVASKLAYPVALVKRLTAVLGTKVNTCSIIELTRVYIALPVAFLVCQLGGVALLSTKAIAFTTVKITGFSVTLPVTLAIYG